VRDRFGFTSEKTFQAVVSYGVKIVCDIKVIDSDALTDELCSTCLRLVERRFGGEVLGYCDDVCK
jgi:hypothetical protein